MGADLEPLRQTEQRRDGDVDAAMFEAREVVLAHSDRVGQRLLAHPRLEAQLAQPHAEGGEVPSRPTVDLERHAPTVSRPPTAP